MTDIQPTQTPAPAVSESPVSAPAVETPAPVVTETTPAVVTPATEASASEAPVENILGDVAPAADDVKKSEEPAKADSAPETKPDVKADAKPDVKPEGEAKVELEAKVLPVYEFKLPEKINAEAAKDQIDAFTKILGEIETSKLDHDGFQQTGQKLLEMHAAAVEDSINRLNDYYVGIHEQQKKSWFESFKNDPEIGGENITATVSNLRDAVNTYAGTEAQAAEFRSVMKETGVGNHPAVIRMLANMDAKIRKYETEGNQNRIVPAARPAPSKTKDFQRFYQN